MDKGDGTFKPYKKLSDVLKERPDLFENVNQFPREELSKALKADSGIFSEGEILEIKGSRFEIRKIIRNGLKLKLLPREEVKE